MDSHSKVLTMLGLPAEGLDGSPPILADYITSDVGRDASRADMLMAALEDQATAAQFYGNLYVLEPLPEGVRIRYLYDEARIAVIPFDDVLVWLRRWRDLLRGLPAER